MYVYRSGHCPVQDCEQEITIEYIDIPAVGRLPENCKKFHYCEYNADNSSCDELKCPIFVEAPESI